MHLMIQSSTSCLFQASPVQPWSLYDIEAGPAAVDFEVPAELQVEPACDIETGPALVMPVEAEAIDIQVANSATQGDEAINEASTDIGIQFAQAAAHLQEEPQLGIPDGGGLSPRSIALLMNSPRARAALADMIASKYIHYRL
jgi:hypothetical protein